MTPFARMIAAPVEADPPPHPPIEQMTDDDRINLAEAAFSAFIARLDDLKFEQPLVALTAGICSLADCALEMSDDHPDVLKIIVDAVMDVALERGIIQSATIEARSAPNSKRAHRGRAH